MIFINSADDPLIPKELVQTVKNLAGELIFILIFKNTFPLYLNPVVLIKKKQLHLLRLDS